MTTSASSKASEFARKQLEKFGWQPGDGLGKQRDGIREPIKVQKKNNLRGVGYNPHGDFDKEWWTKVYAKASSKTLTKSSDDQIKEDNAPTNNVASVEDAVPITEIESEKQERKRKRKLEKLQRKNAEIASASASTEVADVSVPNSSEKTQRTYRGFVKRATLYGASEQPMESNRNGSNSELESDPTNKPINSSETGQEQDDKKKKTAIKFETLSDEKLLKACEFRTAHYGARHGALATGKLRRIAQQDGAILS